MPFSPNDLQGIYLNVLAGQILIVLALVVTPYLNRRLRSLLPRASDTLVNFLIAGALLILILILPSFLVLLTLPAGTLLAISYAVAVVTSITLLSYAGPHRRRVKLASLLTVFVMNYVASEAIRAATERPTILYIIDSSENMTPYLSKLPEIFRDNLANADPGSDLGLVVTGTGNIPTASCDDITVAVPPDRRDRTLSEVRRFIDAMPTSHPTGVANVQAAVLRGVELLASRRGHHRIIVLPTVIDPQCGIPDQQELAQLARSRGIRYDISVLAIGSLRDGDRRVFTAFAQGGFYRWVRSSAQAADTLNDRTTVPPRRIYGPFAPTTR